MFPIVGGPLHGKTGTYSDFVSAAGTSGGGLHARYRFEYLPFNDARPGEDKTVPQVLWLHTSLVPRLERTS